MEPPRIIERAVERGQSSLSEHDSKLLLASYGVPVTPEVLAATREAAAQAGQDLGFPLVAKACGPDITHKTERNLVATGLLNEEMVLEAYDRIVGNLDSEPYEGVVLYRMVEGERELAMGLIRDPQFGPCVMFGLGGIFTEILKDTAFRVAPITEDDASQMMEEIRANPILGEVRGMPPADTGKLARALVGLGNLGVEEERVAEVDVNPLILDANGGPVAVDALVVLEDR